VNTEAYKYFILNEPDNAVVANLVQLYQQRECERTAYLQKMGAVNFCDVDFGPPKGLVFSRSIQPGFRFKPLAFDKHKVLWALAPDLRTTTGQQVAKDLRNLDSINFSGRVLAAFDLNRTEVFEVPCGPGRVEFLGACSTAGLAGKYLVIRLPFGKNYVAPTTPNLVEITEGQFLNITQNKVSPEAVLLAAEVCNEQ
jgi:hypothetical protein